MPLFEQCSATSFVKNLKIFNTYKDKIEWSKIGKIKVKSIEKKRNNNGNDNGENNNNKNNHNNNDENGNKNWESHKDIKH